jgi:hypothetical protein
MCSVVDLKLTSLINNLKNQIKITKKEHILILIRNKNINILFWKY